MKNSNFALDFEYLIEVVVCASKAVGVFAPQAVSDKGPYHRESRGKYDCTFVVLSWHQYWNSKFLQFQN